MTYNNDHRSTSSGLSFTSVLQLIFIVLKLCKVIDWSWWWVMSPTLISFGIALIAILIIFIVKTLCIKR